MIIFSQTGNFSWNSRKFSATKVVTTYTVRDKSEYSLFCCLQEVHESESSPQSSLFLVTLHHAQLSILSDPIVEGVTRGSEKIKKMDPERFKHFTITIS